MGQFNTLKVSFIMQDAGPSGGGKKELRTAPLGTEIDI